MSRRSKYVQPGTANVWGHDNHQVYGRRTIYSIGTFLLILLGLGVFLGWYFKGGDDVAEVVNDDNVVVVADYDPLTDPDAQDLDRNGYEDGTGRNAVYNFFRSMFAGVDDGLDENPHNLNNIDTNNMNIKSDGVIDGDDSGHSANLALAVDDAVEEMSARTDVRRDSRDAFAYSVFDMINEPVVSNAGEKVGTVHDIFVVRQTGEARAIIIKQDADSEDNDDLTVVGFENILRQNSDGKTFLTLSENRVENKPDFTYAIIKDSTDYISLRMLRAGQILDFEGNVAGEIQSIIYENAEADKIYFELRDRLVPRGVEGSFGIGFDEVKVIRNIDGYDVQLTEEQTKSLAKTLYKVQNNAQN